jgi:hypothetical protein
MHVKICIAPRESMASVTTRALRKSDSNYSSAIVALPTLLLLSFFQRQLVESIKTTGLK